MRAESQGWERYELLVLQQMEEHSELLKNINIRLNTIEVSLASAKAVNRLKAAMWGALGSLLICPLIVGLLLYFLTEKKH